MAPPPDVSSAWQAIAEALLIGLLVGVQREATPGIRPGLRDFLVIALAGGICGLLGDPWLTVAALISIGGLLAVFHFELRSQRQGVTTELAGIAVFCMAFLTAAPGYRSAQPLALGATILLVAFLEMKTRLQKLVRETITETEFNDTLRFLAVVLVVYPLLPEGRYGPRQFFDPRQVWLFVILVASISYVGYFLQKFLGASKGLEYTSILGGLASTTAATLSFGRATREQPAAVQEYWRATVIANIVQFPRALAIVALVNLNFARRCMAPLLAVTVAGVALAFFTRPRGADKAEHAAVAVRNPFRLWPAIQFGALFTAVLFITRMATVEMGAQALYGPSALGGLVDPATVIVSANDLLASGKITVDTACAAVFIGLLANCALKIVLAAYSGTPAFARRTTVAFAIMLGSGALVWAIF